MAKGKFFYGITTSTNNPNKAALPLVLASTALDEGHDILVWFAAEGALLTKKGNAEKMKSPIIGDIGELLKKVIHLGAVVGVCGTCTGFYGIDEPDLVEGIKKQTALWAVQTSVGRNCLTF